MPVNTGLSKVLIFFSGYLFALRSEVIRDTWSRVHVYLTSSKVMSNMPNVYYTSPNLCQVSIAAGEAFNVLIPGSAIVRSSVSFRHFSDGRTGGGAGLV